MEEKTRQELLKSIYEQHWLHARHVEYERLWFMIAFVPAVGGLFILFYQIYTGNDVSRPLWYVPIALIVMLCILGYVLSLTWRAPFVEHTTLAREMAEQYPELRDYAPYTRPQLYRIIKVRWISAHQLFLYFYIAIGLFVLSGGISLAGACPYWHILSAVLLGSGVGVERYYQRREEKYRKEMEKRKVDIQHDKNT